MKRRSCYPAKGENKPAARAALMNPAKWAGLSIARTAINIVKAALESVT